MFRRVALALLCFVAVGCTSQPVRTTASYHGVTVKKMSLEEIFIDDTDEKLADVEQESEPAQPSYQAERANIPYNPGGDVSIH